MSINTNYAGNLNDHQIAAVDAIAKLRHSIAEGKLTTTDLQAALEFGLDDGGIDGITIALDSARRAANFAAKTYYSRTLTKDSVKHSGVTINKMKPGMWREMTGDERGRWKMYWRLQGHDSFQCTVCGFPSAYGRVGCESCDPEVES